MTSKPRNGRIVVPKMLLAIRKIPTRSMTNELSTRSPLRATGLGGEPSIDAGGQLVETVADTRLRQSARADERLGPEPEAERRHDRKDANRDRPHPHPDRHRLRLSPRTDVSPFIDPPARHGRPGCGFAFGANAEHGFDSIANVVHERCRPRATGGDLERFTHVNRDGERPVHRRHVGQIFLQPLDRFEHALRAWVSFEIARRIERKLLRQVKPRKLVPAPLALGVGESPFHQFRKDRRAERAHPRRDVAFPLLDLPLVFERPEDVVDQPRQSLGNRGVPELADELQLLEAQDRIADEPQSFDQRQLGSRRPGKTRLDPIEDGRGALFEPAQKAVPQRDRYEQGACSRLGLRALLRGGMGDECRPFIERTEPVVGARDDPLRKDHERPARFDQQIDGGLDGRAIEPLPVHAERTEPPAGATPGSGGP